jgi:hypothetical protein
VGRNGSFTGVSSARSMLVSGWTAVVPGNFDLAANTLGRELRALIRGTQP